MVAVQVGVTKMGVWIAPLMGVKGAQVGGGMVGEAGALTAIWPSAKDRENPPSIIPPEISAIEKPWMTWRTTGTLSCFRCSGYIDRQENAKSRSSTRVRCYPDASILCINKRFCNR